MKLLLKVLEVAWSVRQDVWSHGAIPVSSNNKPAGHLQSTEVKAAGEMIEVDFMGPFLLSKAWNSVLKVVVDHFSKWVELFTLKDAKISKVLSDP